MYPYISALRTKDIPGLAARQRDSLAQAHKCKHLHQEDPDTTLLHVVIQLHGDAGASHLKKMRDCPRLGAMRDRLIMDASYATKRV